MRRIPFSPPRAQPTFFSSWVASRRRERASSVCTCGVPWEGGEREGGWGKCGRAEKASAAAAARTWRVCQHHMHAGSSSKEGARRRAGACVGPHTTTHKAAQGAQGFLDMILVLSTRVDSEVDPMRLVIIAPCDQGHHACNNPRARAHAHTHTHTHTLTHIHANTRTRKQTRACAPHPLPSQRRPTSPASSSARLSSSSGATTSARGCASSSSPPSPAGAGRARAGRRACGRVRAGAERWQTYHSRGEPQRPCGRPPSRS